MSEESLPVWDEGSALARVRGKPKRLARLVGMFVNDIPNYKESLEKAINGGDAEQARHDAHTIKGAVANLSGMRLQSMAARIEEAAKEANLSKAGELWPEFESDFSELNQRFEAWLSEQQNEESGATG